MSVLNCRIEGEVRIVTREGLIRCVGNGSSLDITFKNLPQLIRIGKQTRGRPRGRLANRLLAIARHAGIEVKLRIGNRVVGNVTSTAGQNRPQVRLRFLKLAAAVLIGDKSERSCNTCSGQPTSAF